MSNEKPLPPNTWIEHWKREARITPPSHQLPDRTLSARYNNDFRGRESVALHDILGHMVTSLLPSIVEIGPNGMATFNLSTLMAEQLGLGPEPTTIQDTSTEFSNPAVRNTTGLAIWLKPDFFDVHANRCEEECEGSIRPAIIGLCDALSAKYQIAIYPAFIPINSTNSAAGSVLVLMSDSKGQNELLGLLRNGLVRELKKISNTAPDNPNKPPSASR